MLTVQSDGTVMAGEADVLCILHNAQTQRWHVAFFEEHPLPSQGGASISELDSLRLKSRFTHTSGGETIDDAREHLADMRTKLIVDDRNVASKALPWDGELGIVWMVPNWRKADRPIDEVLATFVGSVVTS